MYRYNHYLRMKTTYLVTATKAWNEMTDVHIELKDCEVIEEPCNPVRLFLQCLTHLKLVDMKPNETIYEFADNFSRNAWNHVLKLKENEDE